jgi:hypothetical protein
MKITKNVLKEEINKFINKDECDKDDIKHIRGIIEQRLKDITPLNENNMWKYYNNFDEYRRQNEIEMEEFHVMRKNVTGLPVNVFIDDAASYKLSNHPLWLYFQNDYNEKAVNTNRLVLPISIEKSPKLLVNPNMVQISQSDLNKVIKFVKINCSILKKFADKTISDDKFYWQLKVNSLKLQESTDRMLLTEMGKTLQPNQTGLPYPIWVDESEQYLDGGHGPRIKIFAVKGEKPNTRTNFASMTISDNPMIVSKPVNYNLSRGEEKLYANFVVYNKNLLLNLSHGKLKFQEEFESNITKIDDKGNSIQPPKTQTLQYTPFSKTCFGFTMVKSNNKLFNFVNSKNGKLISPNQWFTSAGNFTKYENNTVAAMVEVNNNWYLLYRDGNMKPYQ